MPQVPGDASPPQRVGVLQPGVLQGGLARAQGAPPRAAARAARRQAGPGAGRAGQGLAVRHQERGRSHRPVPHVRLDRVSRTGGALTDGPARGKRARMGVGSQWFSGKMSGFDHSGRDTDGVLISPCGQLIADWPSVLVRFFCSLMQPVGPVQRACHPIGITAKLCEPDVLSCLWCSDLRPLPISPRRRVPRSIPWPEWAETGYPEQEIESRQQRTVEVREAQAQGIGHPHASNDVLGTHGRASEYLGSSTVH